MDKVRAGAISNNHCSTAACRDSSIPSYIGWMFLSDSCTSSASWCSTACMVKHLRTSWNILCQPVAGVIPSYIGWMFLSDCTNSASWCSTACTVKRLSTSWNCASQSQVSHHSNIFAPLPSSSWSYRVTSSAPMADGLSVWLVRRSGIPCRTACGIQLSVGTVSDNL